LISQLLKPPRHLVELASRHGFTPVTFQQEAPLLVLQCDRLTHLLMSLAHGDDAQAVVQRLAAAAVAVVAAVHDLVDEDAPVAATSLLQTSPKCQQMTQQKQRQPK
jgi:hypothetical protein